MSPLPTRAGPEGPPAAPRTRSASRAGTCTLALATLGCGGARTLGDEDRDPDDLAICGAWTEAAADPVPRTPAAPPPAPGRFVDITDAAGIDHRQFVPTEPPLELDGPGDCLFDRAQAPRTDCEPQWATGGVAVGDVDGDGWPDLFFTRLAAPDRLYLNRGDGTFEDATAAAGLDDCTFTNGAAFGDIDGDGDADLVVTSLYDGAHRIYVNDGRGHFDEQGEARGLPSARALMGTPGGQSVGLGDYDGDGHLDLHLGSWLRPRHVNAAPVSGSVPAPLSPRLLRNRGDGTFEDTTDAAGVSFAGRRDDGGVYAFASAFADLDGDGHPELLVAADFRSSALFRNRGDGTFEDLTGAAGINREANAMGSAIADLDGDGQLDWFVTAIAQRASCGAPPCPWLGSGNRLYLNRGDGTFDERSEALGLRDAAWGWGATFADLDNDGRLEVVAVNGWPGPDLEGGLALRDTPARLWVREGDRYVDRAEALDAADRRQGRAVVAVDLDLDGDLDLVIANHADRPTLLRNDLVSGADAHWLSVRVHGGAGSHVEARGAVVRVWSDLASPPAVGQVGVGAHFLTAPPLEQHFGLGVRDRAALVEVEWPASGRRWIARDLTADRRIEVYEADATPTGPDAPGPPDP